MLLSSDQRPRRPIALAKTRLRLKIGCFLYCLGHPLSQKFTFFFCHRGKEKYPIFINMSRQQHRNERARVLRKLIGKNFKTLRDYHGLTIEQVAEATKIPIAQLKRLEAGRLNVTPSHLVIICDYFHVLIDCMARQDLSLHQ
jgi:Helix-turn-helix domain